MGRLVDAISPPRLGRSFRWLVASSWVSNIGDGVAIAAGPLLVASETHDPVLVALAALLQRVPWLLFGLHAGVAADRLDRRRLVVLVDLARAGVLGTLAISIATGQVNVAVVLVAMFVLGTAETFADVTTNTLLPMLVAPVDLGVANSRLMFGFITANQLIGPPLGALLFAAGRSIPFVTQGVLVAAGALLVSRIVAPLPERQNVPSSPRRQIAEGLRWLWGNPPVRTLTLTILAFNITFGAAWAVLVLYASERLGLGDVGFGLLTTASALGGVLGAWGYSWIERRVSLADIMRIGLIIETLTHLTLALTRLPAVAMATMFVFGVHTAAWGTTSTSIRQRAVPREFQGRVASVYMVSVHGSIVVGSAIGGVVARFTDVTGPFWFAFVGSAVILSLMWRELGHIAHTDRERTTATVTEREQRGAT